jgi:hypothetical protein
VRLIGVIAGVLAIVTAAAAHAAPAADAAAAATVTSYPPSFFAGTRPNTAYDMINALPGFTLATGDQVRGFAGAAGNVLIDGDRPATKNDSLDEILRRIPANTVARIDLIRGGAPGIDMQGRTVIANIVRKADTPLHLAVGVQGTALTGGILDYGLRVDGGKRSGGVLFEGSLLAALSADDGTGNGAHTVTNALGAVSQRDEERSLGQAGINKVTGAAELPFLKGSLRIEGSFVDSPYWSRANDLSPLPAAQQTELFKTAPDTGEVGVRFVRGLSPSLHLELYGLQQLNSFTEDDNLVTPFDRTLFRLSKHQGESILRGELTSDVSRALQARYGVEGDFNWLVSRTSDTDHGLPIFVPAANITVSELRGEAFADMTWRAKVSLVVEAGLRVEGSVLSSRGDVVNNQTFVFPKPRVVVTWSPDSVDQLQLRAEREVAQLDFGNFAATGSLESGEHAGNPKLIPQQDWVFEATYDRRFWTGGDVDLAFRQYWDQDVIDFAPVCGTGACTPSAEFDAPQNIGSGEKRELAASLTLPTDNLLLKNGQLVIRATWRESRVTDPSSHRGRQLSQLHPLDAEAHFTQGLPRLKSTWGFDAYGPWRQAEYHFNEVDTQRLGPWLDVYFEYKPRPDISLKFEGDNLLSHGLRQTRAFYAPFRDVAGSEVASTDDRNVHFGPEFTVRLRKTFG